MAIERINWKSFYESLNWRQGEHLSILGATGGGKTRLALALLPLRTYISFLATKPRDETITRYGRRNKYELIRKWPPSPRSERVLLWPKFIKPGDEVNQAKVFYEAMMAMFVEGGWSVYVDEAYYFSKVLKFDAILRIYWTQARSNDVTLIASTQRPRDVPLLMYDQATHLFFFRFRDKRDLDRLSEIGWLDGREIKENVARLQLHEFLYVNNITGKMVISKVEET